MKPSVLLLDEPSAGLSPMLQDETFIRVRQVNKAGVSVVIVEQNARRCLQICDRGYVLDQGRNAYSGKGRDLMNDPKVVSLYLGNLEEEVQEEGSGPRKSRNGAYTAFPCRSTYVRTPSGSDGGLRTRSAISMIQNSQFDYRCWDTARQWLHMPENKLKTLCFQQFSGFTFG